jgi:UDP-N-acetylglucosamine--N-acetylmuramyl-(pentapeptide) pyrophosphoryl-undecaprenol N-acetylglucosamine transferase
VPYIDNMDELMNAADIVVARAGSTTIAEISALCIPSILIPFPRASADHQTKNAQPLKDAGAALVISDAKVAGELGRSLIELIENESQRAAMRTAAHSLDTRNASQALAQLVYKQAQ